MTRSAIALLLLASVLAPSARAQPAPKPSATETVIVTAPRFHAGVTPNAIAHDFIKSFAMPSILTDQIARWEIPICPAFLGVAPQYAAVMDYHFRQIAKKAGASLKDKGCKPNLAVFFTNQPQAQLSAVRAKLPDGLGYHAAAGDTHPIQAWYATGTTDLDGVTARDEDAAVQAVGPDGSAARAGCPCIYSTEPATLVGGWRFHPDVRSALLYVTIIVDSTKTAHETVGAIADYVAMLALSRSEDYGDCQLIPSITNLLSPCDDKLKPDAITPSDIAYLKGVYKMDAGATLQVQQNQIAAEMQKALGGQ